MSHETDDPTVDKPGRMTIAELKLAEIGEPDEITEAELTRHRIDKIAGTLGDLLNGPNFKFLLVALVIMGFGPFLLCGIWAIDGGIKADGWGCLGTADFCAVYTIDMTTDDLGLDDGSSSPNETGDPFGRAIEL